MASCVEHGEWGKRFFACPKCFHDGDVSRPISRDDKPSQSPYSLGYNELAERVVQLERELALSHVAQVPPPEGLNAPGELDQVYRDLMNGDLVLVRDWFKENPYCGQREQKASQAICRSITPSATPRVCPRCGDEWRGQACVADCPLHASESGRKDG